MFKRRAERGQCFHRPYLGTREFACDFDWVEGPIPASEWRSEHDLGYMLHDIQYAPATGKAYDLLDAAGRPLLATPRFFRPVARDGVIDVPPIEEALP